MKYWGKLEPNLNISLNSSLSLTLNRKDIFSETKVKLTEKKDSFVLRDMKGKIIKEGWNEKLEIAKKFFEFFKKSKFFVEIESQNNFPTEAGLASSSSGYSSISLALARVTDYFGESDVEKS